MRLKTRRLTSVVDPAVLALVAVCLLAVGCGFPIWSVQTPDRPNMILILTDDLDADFDGKCCWRESWSGLLLSGLFGGFSVPPEEVGTAARNDEGRGVVAAPNPLLAHIHLTV
jgi:hypothetical protein